MKSLKHAWVLAVALASCGGPPEVRHEAAVPKRPPPPKVEAEPLDPLGPKPETPLAPAFVPPAPTVIHTKEGLRVWLLRKTAVPMVSFSLVVPSGASDDPVGKAGLARLTANMLDEGAGDKDAIALSRAVELLGAEIGTSSDADASYVSLTTLSRNVDAAFRLFADVVARPRFEAKEFRRVHELWQNDLRARKSDPEGTARVVARRVLFGEGHPYSLPWDGTLDSAKRITLEDVKRFYKTMWHPHRATLVVVGDIGESDARRLVEAHLSHWRSPNDPSPPVKVPGPPKGPWPKLVLVDRPEAPQSIVMVVRPGVAAAGMDAAVLPRVSTAIGGSFTSRLNQSLREEHGWSYGARSVFSMSRGVGQIQSSAAVITEKTGDALREMLRILEDFSAAGLTEDEVVKTRAQARGDLVSTFESLEATAARLSANAGIPLPEDYLAKASRLRDEADRQALSALAKKYYDPKEGTVIVVGPVSTILPMLSFLPAPEFRDAEGGIEKREKR